MSGLRSIYFSFALVISLLIAFVAVFMVSQIYNESVTLNERLDVYGILLRRDVANASIEYLQKNKIPPKAILLNNASCLKQCNQARWR